MIGRKKYYVIVIIIFPLLVTYLHFSIFKRLSPHIVLEELYYIPLGLGSLFFGLRGALLIYLYVSALYLPYFSENWTATYLSLIDRLLHLLFSGMFTFLTGFLVDRDKEFQKQSERDRLLASIGKVSTTIVHDLKNPLITILGFAKHIREGKDNPDVAIQAIIESARNMERIVYDVLDFTKPTRFEFKEEDIRGILNRACDSCMVKAEGEGVTLSIDIPAEPVTMAIDSFQTQRALINLVDNAIEASRNGQNVIISMKHEKNDMVIKIKDRGIGIDKETIENIFMPFYSKKSAGTGLGMYIAKRIIEGQGGKIRVKSKTGWGTEVMLELPYKLLKEKKKGVV